MIIEFVDNPYVLNDYELIGAIHPAFNRIGANASTATIAYNDNDGRKTTTAYYNKDKIVAMVRNGIIVAVVSKKNERYRLPNWACSV